MENHYAEIVIANTIEYTHRGVHHMAWRRLF